MAREFRQVQWRGAARRRGAGEIHCVAGIHLAIVEAARAEQGFRVPYNAAIGTVENGEGERRRCFLGDLGDFTL